MAKLFVREGERTWMVDLAEGEDLVLGRDAACDLPVDTPRASRRHLAIEADGEGHRARDLGSTNGTRLRGAALEAPTRLEDGDVLEVGGCEIVYRSAP